MDVITFSVLLCIVCSIISSCIYQRAIGFFLGLLLGPIGVIVSAILSLDREYKEQTRLAAIEQQKNQQKKQETEIATWELDLLVRQAAIAVQAAEKISKRTKEIDRQWKKLKESGNAWN